MDTKKKRGRPSQDKVARPYTVDKDVATFIDAMPDGDRSRFVNKWMKENPDFIEWKERNMATKQLKATMEKFLESEDFKAGVISSTKAGWGGSCYNVELFPDGKWSVLWSNQIGNLYETPGVIIALPELETEEMQEMIDGGAADDEDDFLSMAFENECEEIKDEFRTYFSEE